MTNEELQEKLKELDRERQLESSLANSSRAQSITVGNAGSGSVECDPIMVSFCGESANP